MEETFIYRIVGLVEGVTKEKFLLFELKINVSVNPKKLIKLHDNRKSIMKVDSGLKHFYTLLNLPVY